jgi:RNA polymerase sigma factor (sigma-70 family)
VRGDAQIPKLQIHHYGNAGPSKRFLNSTRILVRDGSWRTKSLQMPERKLQRHFDLDLAVMDDEALIVLAEECEYGPARDELIVRYDVQIDRLIGWMARSYRLVASDVEDARQNAVFWVVEAITKYDTEQMGKVRGCSFRSFVYRVLMSRFKDFTKHLRRVECRYDRSTHFAVEDIPQGADGEAPEDPAQIAEEMESLNHLHQTLSGLDNDSGRLWERLAEGASLRQIAAELEVSYDTVKRRRRKLIQQLKMRLNQTASN